MGDTCTACHHPHQDGWDGDFGTAGGRLICPACPACDDGDPACSRCGGAIRNGWILQEDGIGHDDECGAPKSFTAECAQVVPF